MKIQILPLVTGAQKATGLIVIIDVFRAFSLEAYMYASGAKKVIPVKTVEDALALKKENPSYILVGERKGIKVEGFDYGNSPSEFVGVDLSGKTLIHTTSAGVLGLASAVNASQIVTGALVNAKATAKYTLDDLQERVDLLKQQEGAKFFDPNKPQFPEEDFWLCTKVDIIDGVNVISKNENQIQSEWIKYE